MFCFVLGATSVTPTMLRLTSPFSEGDGRYVLILDDYIQNNKYLNSFTSKSFFLIILDNKAGL